MGHLSHQCTPLPALRTPLRAAVGRPRAVPVRAPPGLPPALGARPRGAPRAHPAPLVVPKALHELPAAAVPLVALPSHRAPSHGRGAAAAAPPMRTRVWCYTSRGSVLMGDPLSTSPPHGRYGHSPLQDPHQSDAVVRGHMVPTVTWLPSPLTAPTTPVGTTSGGLTRHLPRPNAPSGSHQTHSPQRGVPSASPTLTPPRPPPARPRFSAGTS